MADETHRKPRVGIPWRTRAEELERNVGKLNHYFDAVRRAGADPEPISLAGEPSELREQVARLDGFVLPGSPADVDPARYGEPRHPTTRTVDPARDRTDSAILEHALAAHKPVLAICYGCQILNVHQGGTLVQDIASERPASVAHGQTDLAARATRGDLEHGAKLVPGSLLGRLAGSEQARINSSHHQAIGQPGRGLRVTALGSDGIVEGVELDSPGDWVVGVQWHPERMPDDRFAGELFRDFVEAARKAPLLTTAKG
jgi:putative glutamine amidotransferase